jgi:hypothetical protein
MRIQKHIRRHPAVSVVALLAALGGVPTLAWSIRPDSDPPDGTHRANPSYLTQASASSAAVRRQHVQNRGDEDVDAAVETCGGLGVSNLAARYELPDDDARAVARRFAADFEPAFRDEVVEGCLHGLRHGG